MDTADLREAAPPGPPRSRVAWIFAAGPDAAMPAWPWLPQPDVAIAADGGLAHALRLGQVPAVALGDFDSIDPATLAEFQARHPECEVRHYVHEMKVETDAELGVVAAAEQGATEVVLTGVLGGRWDHSLANLLLLTHPLLGRIPARLVSADTEVFLLRGRAALQVWGRPGDTVSVLPLDTVEGVTLSGLQYPLLEETLYTGFGRGVSNVLAHPPASISIRNGLAWVVVIHQAE